jgi:hypothetical protein
MKKNFFGSFFVALLLIFTSAILCGISYANTTETENTQGIVWTQQWCAGPRGQGGMKCVSATANPQCNEEKVCQRNFEPIR